jgi:hypothetical protein
MTNFTTTITSMYTLDTPDPGYVVNALWQVTGVSGEYTASIGGNTQFNSADQEGAFIPYDRLQKPPSSAGFLSLLSPAHSNVYRDKSTA